MGASLTMIVIDRHTVPTPAGSERLRTSTLWGSPRLQDQLRSEACARASALRVRPVLFHGVYTNLRFRALGGREFYNPGLAAVVFGHIPIGIWYIVEGYSEHAISGWDWLIAVIYAVAFMVATLMKMTYDWLADRNSPYPFDAEEMARFNVDARLHVHAAKGDAVSAS